MLRAGLDDANAEDDKKQAEIEARSDIESTEKEQLILARRGQGVFRRNVFAITDTCCITGIANPLFLIASHIKPWRDCSNAERLDGYNGLPLSPHVDRLFDKGWITFETNGSVVRSPKLDETVWKGWNLSLSDIQVHLQDDHKPYIAYHRSVVFQD